MIKFLKGLLIIILGLILFFIRVILLGKSSLDILALILLLISLCALVYAIADMING